MIKIGFDGIAGQRIGAPPSSKEDGETDIFPDEAGQQMFATWKNDYRELEAMVSEMHHAA